MKKAVSLQEIKDLSNKYRDKFYGVRKVFVVSPPRCASTLLSIMLNLNPKIFIFCESCIHDLCNGQNGTIGRIAKLSNLTVDSCKSFVTTCNKSNIPLSDMITFVFSKNNVMRKAIETNMAIGDKTPQITGKIKFLKYMNDNFQNNFFPGVIKNDLSLIIRSAIRTQIDDGSNRTDEQIFGDIVRFSTDMVNFIIDGKNYIENNAYNNIRIYDYKTFVNRPAHIIDSLYKWILGNTNSFQLLEYSVEKYKDKINEILNNAQLGYLGHHLLIDKKKNRKLANHQQGLLKEISGDICNYSDDYWVPLYNKICNNEIVADNINKQGEVMNEFPFAISMTNYELRPAFRRGVCIQLTGLSGSGKTTLATNIKNKLDIVDKEVVIIDGDEFRSQTKNTDFSKKGRLQNLKRAAEYARTEVEQGKIAICAFVSPYREFRKMVKETVGVNRFIEVFVDSPLEVCIKRDVKGLYKKSLNGTISNFTGMTDPYEPPLTPHLRLDTYRDSITICVDKVIKLLFNS